MASLKFNAWNILSRAVEEGLEFGWNRAHKHWDTPDKETIIEHMEREIMNKIADVLENDNDKET